MSSPPQFPASSQNRPKRRRDSQSSAINLPSSPIGGPSNAASPFPASSPPASSPPQTPRGFSDFGDDEDVGDDDEHEMRRLGRMREQGDDEDDEDDEDGEDLFNERDLAEYV